LAHDIDINYTNMLHDYRLWSAIGHFRILMVLWHISNLLLKVRSSTSSMNIHYVVKNIKLSIQTIFPRFTYIVYVSVEQII